VSPEEWIGRYGHELHFAGALALDWDDPAVDAWCKRVLELAVDLPERGRLQRQYLTDDEYSKEVRRESLS
jgi:hypothetical protein